MLSFFLTNKDEYKCSRVLRAVGVAGMNRRAAGDGDRERDTRATIMSVVWGRSPTPNSSSKLRLGSHRPRRTAARALAVRRVAVESPSCRGTNSQRTGSAGERRERLARWTAGWAFPRPGVICHPSLPPSKNLSCGHLDPPEINLADVCFSHLTSP